MNLENQASADLADDALALFDDMDSGDVDNTETETIADEDGDADDEPRDTEDDDDEADGGDSSEEEPAGGEDEDEPRPKSRAQKRIDQLTREKNDARRETEHFQRQAEEANRKFDDLLRQVQTMQLTPEQRAAGQEVGMSEDQTLQLVRQKAEQMVERERFGQKVTDLRQRLENGGASDALARVSNQRLTAFEPVAVDALAEAKFPVEVIKTIAENEEVFSRFSSLPDGVSRARFIDRLDGRLESRTTRKTQKPSVSKTPRVRGGTRKPDKSPDDMSQAEYEAWARKQGLL